MTISNTNRANLGGNLQLVPVGGNDSTVRRAETDLAHRSAPMGHDTLASRTLTMPRNDNNAPPPPRAALTALPPLPTFPNAGGGAEASPPHTGGTPLLDLFELSSRRTPHFRDNQAPNTQAQAPAGQSWRAALGAALGHAASGVAKVAIGAKDEVAGQLSALKLLNPGTRLPAAALGHLIHQAVSVGVPTFAREMMAEALILSMRHMPPTHALGLQLGVSVVNVGAQAVRRMREARNPDAAARGFHAISKQQWDQLAPADQDKLRAQQQLHSRMLTNIQVAASLTHLTLGAHAAITQDKGNETASKLFVKDFKTLVYSGMRDSLQASFQMVNPGKDTQGVSGTHMTAAATFYALANAGGNYAFSHLPGMVPNAQVADQVLRGQSDAMSSSQAWLTKAGVAGVKAAINTVVEASDWMSVTQQEANQAGTKQKWEPELKLKSGNTPDYGRLLDQTPGRIAAISGSNAIFSIVGAAMEKSPQWAQDAVGNLANAAYAGLQYKTVGGTWQADGAVRAQPNEAAATAQALFQDLERGRTQQTQPPPQTQTA
ncbi:hypothetical protein [Hydrogenophaga soli]|nr:hypothetical protein [Burkholderiaceae bacterium]